MSTDRQQQRISQRGGGLLHLPLPTTHQHLAQAPHHADKPTIQGSNPKLPQVEEGRAVFWGFQHPCAWWIRIMELHCLPTETPTTASSCSTDPLYDNCPPFAQRGRFKDKEMESRVVCPAVTRLPGPCSPLPGLAPAEVPTLVSGGRGTGSWPDHSYCSWRRGLGKQDWEAELNPGINRTRGGERGGEQGGSWGNEDRAHLNQSEEHRSALSLYDNLPNTSTPDNLQEVFDMETSFQEQMYRAWAPEQVQGQRDEDGGSEDKSSWSSCEIILAESVCSNQDQNPEQDMKHEQEPELDSVSCGFKQEEPMLHLRLPMSPPQRHLAASFPQLPQAEAQVLWPPAGAQPSWPPRVPPPVPPADPSASALRSLLTSLQQQIVRQREEYEERINR